MQVNFARLKYKYYGVNEIAISSILARNNSDWNKVIKQVKFFFKRFMVWLTVLLSVLIGSIDRNRLWRDGIHLTNEGTSLLSKNVLEHLNSFFH